MTQPPGLLGRGLGALQPPRKTVMEVDFLVRQGGKVCPSAWSKKKSAKAK